MGMIGIMISSIRLRIFTCRLELDDLFIRLKIMVSSCTSQQKFKGFGQFLDLVTRILWKKLNLHPPEIYLRGLGVKELHGIGEPHA